MESFALEMLRSGRRIDGRGFEEFRKIEIIPNIVEKAEGSAEVRLGKTKVAAGVKLDVGQPFKDSPEEGILIVNAEFSPIASPEFEPGPPGEDAIELARVVDRAIRESECIDFSKLCITPGEKVWIIFIDIHILDDHGNLLDASALASLVALMHTRIPKFENDEIVRGEYMGKLEVDHKPIVISMAKTLNHILVDPTLEEEEIAECLMSFCIREDGKICAIQKRGGRELSLEDIEKMIEIASKKSEEIRRLLE